MKKSTRRSFLKTSAVAAGAALTLEQAVYAAGGDQIRVGLIGCGGRGTGAAGHAMRAENNVKLYAMADAFEDRLESSLKRLQADNEIANKIDVARERRFTGFDAYRAVIATCDVVLLTTPPHFRPIHLRAAIEAGRHAFVEKPVAVDAPGVRSVLATCELARKRNLSVVSGLQMRYSYPHKEAVERIHKGAIGQIQAMQADDFRGMIWTRPREQGWTDMQYQMRNWYYYTWLSGDFNVEQHVHMLDLASFVKGGYPVRAMGTGGRQVRTLPEHGHIFDHFAINYEYEDGSRLFAQCRQQPPHCANNIGLYVFGTRGRASFSSRRGPGGGVSITTDKEWRYSGKEANAQQTEHDEFFASIRNGRPINNGEYMSKSTLLAIQGRMAGYTGQIITWEMAMNSKEDLSPPSYDWNQKLPEPPVASPGTTRYM